MEVEQSGKNLLPPNSIITGYFINVSGVVSSSTGWSCTDFISVVGGKNYYFQPNTTSGNAAKHAYYDAGKNMIGYFDSGARLLDLPENARYVRLSMRDTSTNMQLEVGSTATAYEPYKGKPTIPISWQSSAGTVYGGSLDLTSGVLTDEMGVLTLDSNIPSGTGGFRNLAVLSEGVRCEYYPYRAIGKGNSAKVYSDKFANRDASTGTPYSIITNIGDPRLLVCLPLEYDTVDKFIAYFTANPLDIYYYKATPTTYQLTPTQVSTFLGVNNFWSNSNGQIDLEYRADTKLYIEQLTKPSEDDMTANANIASGKFFMIGNRLMLSTTAIAQGEQIVVGTNCSELSLADGLNLLNS